jgi:hypothetical protein
VNHPPKNQDHQMDIIPKVMDTPVRDRVMSMTDDTLMQGIGISSSDGANRRLAALPFT